MADVIQANLKPQTVQRIAEIAKRPVTRGLDKMINECLDTLEAKGNCGSKNHDLEGQKDVE
jgi:hypothetical protein